MNDPFGDWSQALRSAKAEAARWRNVADQLADTLLRNGVGGAAFNKAMEAYRTNVVLDDKPVTIKAGGKP